jgi:type IV pilus assembly protein PilM
MSHTVALDLGTYTVKAIQGKPGKKVKIERTVESFNTTGLAIPNDDANAEKLAQLINNIFADHSLSKMDVRLSIPESFVSTKIISIPPLTDAELASAINWQAEQHIPIPLEELALEYQVLYRPSRQEKEGQMRVLMVGIRKSLVDRYLDVFLRAGIEPTVIETQTISILRALQVQLSDPPTLIVHSGASTTDMSIAYKGELRFVYTFASAGQFLTRTAEQAIQLDAKQAEQYKRTYGLDGQQLEGKMRDILLPAVKVTVLEIQKAIQFFATQSNVEPIKRVLLSGGTAQLPGLVQYITEQVGVEVSVVTPFVAAEGELPKANLAAFTVCMGLMMREG